MTDTINLKQHNFSDEHIGSMVEVFKAKLALSQDLRKAVLSVMNSTQSHATPEEIKDLLELRIAPAERKFLICLIDSPGKIVHTSTIMDALYFPNDPPSESYNVIRQYCCRLRRILKRLGWTVVCYKDYGYMLQKIKLGDNKIPLEMPIKNDLYC